MVRIQPSIKTQIDEREALELTLGREIVENLLPHGEIYKGVQLGLCIPRATEDALFHARQANPDSTLADVVETLPPQAVSKVQLLYEDSDLLCSLESLKSGTSAAAAALTDIARQWSAEHEKIINRSFSRASSAACDPDLPALVQTYELFEGEASTHPLQDVLYISGKFGIEKGREILELYSDKDTVRIFKQAQTHPSATTSVMGIVTGLVVDHGPDIASQAMRILDGYKDPVFNSLALKLPLGESKETSLGILEKMEKRYVNPSAKTALEAYCEVSLLITDLVEDIEEHNDSAIADRFLDAVIREEVRRAVLEADNPYQFLGSKVEEWNGKDADGLARSIVETTYDP